MTPLVYLAFLLSGASALVFETLWFRLAGLAFGNSVWASSIVLAAFMGGIGLGNLVAVRHATRIARPLVVYALLELAIAATGFGVVAVLPRLTPLLAEVFQPFLDAPLVLQPLRLGVAFGLLLVPAAAMGMTLPILVRALTKSDPNFGRVLGRLYGFNTLGAVLGALGGEAVLIGALGLTGAGVVAALMNVAAAATVFGLSRRLHAPRVEARSGRASLEGVAGGRPSPILAAAFVSGGLLLALEVVWFRFLQLFVLGSSLIFAVMLAVVLLGIGLGALVASAWLGRRPKDYRYAPLLALAAGAGTAFTYLAFDDGFGFYGAFPIKPVPEPWTALWISAGLCGPVSLLSGILFPFLGRALRDETGDETKATALLTFANTLGAMSGSALAGFVLMPGLGVEWSIWTLGVGYLGVFLLAMRAGASDRPRSREEHFAGLAAGGLVVSLFAVFPFGLMANHYIPMTTAPHMSDGSKIVAVREGLTETALYLRGELWDEPRQFRLITNGYAMSASTLRSERYMRMFAYWPAAMHRAPKKALLISYGVGITAQSLTDITELESIDIVDISKDVMDLSREVGVLAGEHPLDDPRVRVHVEDGRFFLLATNETFDIITAEPPPPKNAGIVNLYTKEYFELLHGRLAPGGMATYWLPVYQLALDESKAITGAFCAVFPECTLWTGAGTEWMLVGEAESPAPAHEDAVARLWSQPATGSRLRAMGLEHPEQLGALFLADARFLNRWVGNTPLLVDDFPQRISTRLQVAVGDYLPAMEEYARVMDVREASMRFSESSWAAARWPPSLREAATRYFPVQDVLNRHFDGEVVSVAELVRVLQETDLETLPLLLLGANDRDVGIAARAGARGVEAPGIYYYAAALHMSRRRYRDAVASLDRAIALDPASVELAQYRVLSLALEGREEQARESARSLRARFGTDGGVAGFWSWYDAALAAIEPS